MKQKTLIGGVALLLSTVSAIPHVQADALDFVPHFTSGLVGVRLGDAVLEARAKADLGLQFVKAEGFDPKYEGFADAQLELDLRRKMSFGGTVGMTGKLHARARTNLQTGETTYTNSLKPEDQKALLYVSGSLGRLEAGYLHGAGQAITGDSVIAGRGDLNSDGLTYNVHGLGARYRFISGSHTTQVQADQDLRFKGGYRWKRSYISNTYTLGGDALYAHEETFSLPARASSLLQGRLVRAFGAVAGGQVDYGTLSTSFSAGGEHFRAVSGTSDAETRLFASAGASKKWGRTTLSIAASFERYLDSKYSAAELALGVEVGLSRGVTLVGGYNLSYAMAGNPPAALSDRAIDHNLELAVRLFF